MKTSKLSIDHDSNLTYKEPSLQLTEFPLTNRLSVDVEEPVKFQSDWKSLNPNLVASRLHEILRRDVLPLNE